MAEYGSFNNHLPEIEDSEADVPTTADNGSTPRSFTSMRIVTVIGVIVSLVGMSLLISRSDQAGAQNSYLKSGVS